ncbi:unnamed protein product, partial [Discosporangium mesarthrocarpum]
GAGGSGSGGGNPGEPGHQGLDGVPATPYIRGVSISGWNPPPPQRRMVGDLLYVEVFMMDGPSVHITCTPEGFFINRTEGDIFDPTPSDNACHSHEFLTCLLSYSGSFAKSWAQAVGQAFRQNQADDPVHALA